MTAGLGLIVIEPGSAAGGLEVRLQRAVLAGLVGIGKTCRARYARVVVVVVIEIAGEAGLRQVVEVEAEIVQVDLRGGVASPAGGVIIGFRHGGKFRRAVEIVERPFHRR